MVLPPANLCHVLQITTFEVWLEYQVWTMTTCFPCYVVIYYRVLVPLDELFGCLCDHLRIKEGRRKIGICWGLQFKIVGKGLMGLWGIEGDVVELNELCLGLAGEPLLILIVHFIIIWHNHTLTSSKLSEQKIKWLFYQVSYIYGHLVYSTSKLIVTQKFYPQ